MRIRKPLSPRMVCRLTCCLLAGWAASVSGQEFSTAVDDRVEAPDAQPPLVEDDEVRRGGWDVGVVVSAAYDDNIFLSSSDPESDTVFRAAPTVGYALGDPKEGEGGFIKAAYRPTGVVYAEHGSENRVDQQAIATAGWKGKVTRVVYTGAIQKLGDATADTGRLTDRIEYANELRAGWAPVEKITLELAGGNKSSNYVDPAYYDSSKTYGEAALRYAYSPKTELALVYQIGRFKVEGTGPQHTQQLAGAIVWQPREKIRLNLLAGAEYRKFDNGSGVNPVVNGRLDWTPRKGSEFFINGFAREEASAYFAGQNYLVRGFSAGISQRLAGEWSARLEGGYETNSYEQVSGSGAGGRKDRIWFVKPALVRRFGKDSEVSLFYQASDNSSSDPGFGYRDNMVGVELNHKF